MSALLHSLTFTRRGESGWEIVPLDLGSPLTILLGPNGSGKTPILCGIAFALGHPIQLPPDIKHRCRSVRLTISDGGAATTIERLIEDRFEVRATEDSGIAKEFFEHRTFASWLIQKLGISHRMLTDQKSAPVPPYMSVLIPMFWIDQDVGWRNLYSPLSTHNFVKDQAEEVTRWLLGAPGKNRAIDRDAFQQAKEHLASINEQIAIKRGTLEALEKEADANSQAGNLDQLSSKRDAILSELKSHSSVLQTLAKNSSSFDESIRNATRKRDKAKFSKESAERRLAELRSSGQELQTEVRVLEMNEVAAGAFRTLCGNESCQFFRTPEESFGRRLLYLKDQLKDFESSISAINEEMRVFASNLTEAERELLSALEEKKLSLGKTLGVHVVPIIDALTRDLSAINLRIERAQLLVEKQRQIEAIIDSSLRAEEEVNRLRPTRGTGSDEARLADVRRELNRCFPEWLAALRTQNLPQNISFDDDLRLYLGTERFTENSSFRGSTRTRIVLAYHAAMIEASLSLNGCHPRFLVLDAPRQHEMHAEDLAEFVSRFVEKFGSLAAPTQLVISVKEENFVSGRFVDSLRRPTFIVGGELRFFGVPTPPPLLPPPLAEPG